MEFDATYTFDSGCENAEYGIINGNNTIVFIKAGAQGSYRGYEDKYLRMAKMLHELNGCSVICASNPTFTSFEDFDVKMLSNFIDNRRRSDTRLYYIGVSNGAYQGIVNATKHFVFQKILLVNMPLMINSHKIKEGIVKLIDTRVECVFGKKDPSFRYIPFFEHSIKDYSGKVKIKLIEGADHNFVGLMNEFIELGELIFE